jgi:cell wall-associated NlpC family hydrolase
MKPRSARAVAVALLVSALGALAPGLAGGSPIQDKRAQAQRLQQQIDANGHRVAALGEQYNGAVIAYDKASAAITEAQRRLDAAKAEADAIRHTVTARAVELYMGAGSHNPLDAVDVANINELGARTKYADAAAQRDSASIDRLKRAQEDLAVERRQFEQQQAEARRQKDAAAATKRQIETANADQQRLLGQVKGELARLIDEDRRRRDEAARRAAVARTASRSSWSGQSPAGGAVDPGSVGGNVGGLPTPSGRVAAVIAYARAQLGKPYVFATAGPNTFDCSGLTKMAWAQAGVAMDHFSGSQYQRFPHVPISALQPGDLVFKGPGGRDHVALYIGGGMQIAATHTGDYVRLQPLSRNLSGAVRPG